MPSYYDRRNVDDNWVGGKQDDTMSGNGGNDVIHGGGGKDNIYGGDGNDQLYGDDGNDYLQGGAGNDILNGDAGNDILASASGTDTITGGAGADTIVFNYAADSRPGDGIDTVMDFHPEEGDRINIGRTVESYAYNPTYAVELVSNASLITNDHEQATLTYDQATGITTLNMYFGDGDPDIDMTLYILGNHTTAAGFMDFYAGG
jgi:Ca2+-binding RTX toxin-like protein